MIRHYGLKPGDKVIYDDRKATVIECSKMDNNRVLLEIEEGKSRVEAVAEWCKLVPQFTVTAPKELLVPEINIAEEIARDVMVLEKDFIDRAVHTMLSKQGIDRIEDAEKKGYDVLVARLPDGNSRVQLVKVVDQTIIKVNVCRR